MRLGWNRRAIKGTHDSKPKGSAADTYLDDPAAQEALAQAERMARQRGLRHRFLYLPHTAGPHALADYWRALRPTDTVVVASGEDVLSACPVEREEQTVEGTTPILHYRAAR